MVSDDSCGSSIIFSIEDGPAGVPTLYALRTGPPNASLTPANSARKSFLTRVDLLRLNLCAGAAKALRPGLDITFAGRGHGSHGGRSIRGRLAPFLAEQPEDHEIEL